MPKASAAQLKAQKKYDRANTVQYHLKLNLKTDVEIIDKLKAVDSVQGYIKGLILKDIADDSRNS